jgi:hypothetical protein
MGCLEQTLVQAGNWAQEQAGLQAGHAVALGDRGLFSFAGMFGIKQNH